MALVKNCTAHSISFGAYDAGGKWIKQKWPDIPPNHCRYINQDHIGDMDYCIVLAYMTGSKVPSQVGLTKATRGGGLSLVIAGFGGGLAATWTVEYSSPLAGVRLGRHEMWSLIEKNKEHSFEQVGSKKDCAELHGW